MKLSLKVQRSLPAAPNVAFDFTNEEKNFVTFVGFAVVPGIRQARYVTDGEPRLGSTRRITKTDGTEHTEEIVVFERPTLHVSRIVGLSPPFSWLVRSATDSFRFSPIATGSSVERRFELELTSPLWCVIAFPLLHVFMRTALARDLSNVADALGRQTSTRAGRA